MGSLLTNPRASAYRVAACAGRGLLVVAAFVLALGAFAPACVVAPAHASGESVAAPAPGSHLPHGDPSCCDELRGVADGLEMRVTAARKPAEPPSLALFSAAQEPSSGAAASDARTVLAVGPPSGFAPIPAYLRTLRLRI